ncbi:vacuolar protein sorting-associated protein 35 [Scheffersomyces amazonensis]|uniref:vacuolar protein sorting-associated protein 35 n=1 Tax=Scheffersomyces amazonensis TaxID=1078765 RepID=UPI00315C68CB
MTLPSISEQKAILQGCLNNINHQSNLMKQCLNDNNLLQALKHCSNFLNELRTNQLSPKQYYEMYILIFDSLEYLANHLLNSHNAKVQKIRRKQQRKLENANTGNNIEDGGNSEKSITSLDTTSSPFLSDLYELVQYSGNIIPRLYMMIVIGTTYMATNEAPTKEIMKDMIEMCRGVQHPIRGLFLRYYLSQRTKHLLPFSNSVDFNETIEFLIANFIEMNKLWVRLQHQGHSSERELRYRERKELKILVGSNLVRLSQIIDDYKGNGEEDENYSPISFYKTNIFPTITEQIIQCRDHLAQSYLIDVLIQIFPDDFHFATLDNLLNNVFLNLHPLLKKSELISTLVDRFIVYHKFESDLVTETNEKLVVDDDNNNNKKVKKDQSFDTDTSELFGIFWNFYVRLYESDPDLPVEEHSTILQCYIKLSLTYYPTNLTNLDIIYKFATENLVSKNQDNSENTEELWLQLLVVPIRFFPSVKNLFNLPFFHEFYLKLTNKAYQKQISLEIINKFLGISTNDELLDISPPKVEEFEFEYLTTTDEIDGIFKYLLVLIKDSQSQQLNTSKNLGITKTIKLNNGENGIITQEFLDVQEKFCKVIHLIETPLDPFKNLSNLMYVRRKYLNKNSTNIIYTYPTLINKILYKLKLIGYMNLKQKKKNPSIDYSNQDLLITTNFKNLSIIIDELYQHHQQFNSELILKLYLNAATIADQLKQESLAYELFNQCFIVYEENLILSSHQYNYYHHISPQDSLGGGSLPYQSILLISNKLINTRYFNKENYESLITKLTVYGSKLLKKQDQCRSVYSCAHLWWWCEILLPPGEKSPTVNDNQTDEKSKGVTESEKTEESTKEIKAEAEAETQVKEDEETEPETEPEIEVDVLYRDDKRVLECLQKALRVADSCMDPYLSLKLFIEILNRCLIFNIYGNALVDSRYINGLIDLIRTNIDNLKTDDNEAAFLNVTDGGVASSSNVDDELDKEARLFRQSRGVFERTLDYIRDQQIHDNRFDGIIV